MTIELETMYRPREKIVVEIAGIKSMIPLAFGTLITMDTGTQLKVCGWPYIIEEKIKLIKESK